MKQLTLGELIKKVESHIELSEKEDGRILFDFCGFMPTNIGSYRGDFGQLAISYEESHWDDKDTTPEKFLETLKGCVGKTFTGWKGGDFKMGKHTPMWVANSGKTGSTIVCGVKQKWFGLIIETTNGED